MGGLEGVFVVDKQGWESLQKLIKSKREVHFGEVLGKHSEIVFEIEQGMIKILTEDQDFIAKFIELKCESGFNPLHYIEDDEGEE